MIYIVVKHIEGDHIREIFRSTDFEEASQYLINDFKEYCKLCNIGYMERDFENPDAEIDSPYIMMGSMKKILRMLLMILQGSLAFGTLLMYNNKCRR